MTAPLPEPTTRVTAVLFTADVELMRHRYGHGWTEQLRRMVREDCKEYRKHKKTLEQVMRDNDGQ